MSALAERRRIGTGDTPRGPVWLSMTPEERTTTLAAMSEFGGSFVRSLAATWRYADTINSIRLGAVMGDYVRQYGPGSPVYAMVERGRA
jgi:hypothetical protein